mmetsp:Transcript_8156/g.19468  ORF Transcript_8156/g.19468 Transcript_8156/m.19468 type:complete len:189 (+) Transcript_8156:25-591(+)|eukprot:CAMPEP_0181419302 /NCGR_PEP_ID=MMETSP1110-20121109/12003_1 /TAXON_ID=174948 /ORGANISM="Symbiodinium sp., Strain CCMP421" /LENGTH=188 /DNA_ID=CAMNT_0023542313 /DNA_START=22 /DNA_END=588 /DNA_ORIENTATION=+
MSCFSGLWNWFWGQDGVSDAEFTSDAEVIDCDLCGEVEVKLNLYNLPWLCGANHVLEPFGYGAYHVAVQVLDWELYFDIHKDPLHPCSGIWECRPGEKGQPAHVFVFKTPFSPSQIREILRQLQFEWCAADYCIIRQNCIHFSAAFCERLHVGPFPSWALSLPTALRWLPEALGSPGGGGPLTYEKAD